MGQKICSCQRHNKKRLMINTKKLIK